MIEGMTGFGSAERGGFRVEVRSLNHRFLEISLKMPPALISHEMALREGIKKRFGRGRFDVYVSTVAVGAADVRVNIDTGRAQKIAGALKELKGALGLEGDVDLGLLLQWKELIVSEDIAYDAEALMGAFGEALDVLALMRRKEGGELAADISMRAGNIEKYNEEIASLCPVIMQEGKEEFREKLSSYLGGFEGIEDVKLLQEASAVIEKSDITEEVTRIGGHTRHLRDILAEGGSAGRRIDFLLQELNREVNTIASKSTDSRILKNVIEMKSEIEKAREQAQNLQ